MGFFCGSTWGMIIAIWLILSIVGCIVGGIIYSKTWCESPFAISIISAIAWIVAFIFTVIVNAIDIEYGDIKDTFRENATVIEMHSTSHNVRVGKVWTTRKNYYMTVKGEETGHEEQFQIQLDTFGELSEGATVILDTNTVCTKWTEEIKQDYDWEMGTIK